MNRQNDHRPTAFPHAAAVSPVAGESAAARRIRGQLRKAMDDLIAAPEHLKAACHDRVMALDAKLRAAQAAGQR